MEEKIIIEVLKMWNPWGQKIESGILRKEYIKKIYPLLERKEVLVFKGIRRCGKSTILRQLIEQLIDHGASKNQVLYLNLEDYNFSGELKISLFEQVLSAYLGYTKNKKKIFFFIDEVQKIDGWERYIRTLYDQNRNIKFIVTGSSTKLLSKELSTLLTGRNLSLIIHPLAFREYQLFSKKKGLAEFLQYGGFPEVVLEKSIEKKMRLLRQYFEDILYKDIIGRHAIRNAKQVIELATYLISTSGSKERANRLSKEFGISNEIISLYISYMVEAFLLIEAKFFSYSIKTRHDVAKLPKYYAADNGLINAVNVGYTRNKGQMYENAVAVKLNQEYGDISYWSDQQSEVDFVVSRRAINVTATDDVHQREWKGLAEFGAYHRNFASTLITESGKEEKTISLVDFLLRHESPSQEN